MVKTHGQRWLAKLLRLPVLKQLTHLAYNALLASFTSGTAPRGTGNVTGNGAPPDAPDRRARSLGRYLERIHSQFL